MSLGGEMTAQGDSNNGILEENTHLEFTCLRHMSGF